MIGGLPDPPRSRRRLVAPRFRRRRALAAIAAVVVVSIGIGLGFSAWRAQTDAGHGGALPSGSSASPASPSAAPSGTPAVPSATGTGRFYFASAMVAARVGHTATLLRDGRVLIVGGDDGREVLRSAELYDPATGTLMPTGSTSVVRYQHTATLLPDGEVLIAGGKFGGNTAELYDPQTGTFRRTGSLTSPHTSPRYWGQTATRLEDGRVLIAGGMGERAGNLYDPATGTFTATGSMKVPLTFAAAALLPDGRVLIAGGSVDGLRGGTAQASAELYDPRTGTFSLTGSMSIRRAGLTATALPDGRVLVVGGFGASAEVYDPQTGAFHPTGPMANSRGGATATLLTDGRVLVVGGFGGPAGTGSGECLASAELYDPGTGTFSSTGSMAMCRESATATRLSDGRVLVVGGSGGPAGTNIRGDLLSAELYQP